MRAPSERRGTMKTITVYVLPHENLAASQLKIAAFIGEEQYSALKETYGGKATFLPSVAKTYLLKKFTPNNPLFYGPNGKPYQDGCFFNLSNTKDASVIVVADQECGVDIEGERNMAPGFQQSVFGEVIANEDPIACWTRKEALSKAEGTGLSGAPLLDIPFKKGLSNYKGRDYFVVTGYYERWTISVAIEGSEEFKIQFEEAI